MGPRALRVLLQMPMDQIERQFTPALPAKFIRSPHDI